MFDTGLLEQVLVDTLPLCARSNLKVALIERGIPGGQMNNTSDIENYPGYADISGQTAEKMFEPLENLGGTFVWSGRVHQYLGATKKIVTDDGEFEADCNRVQPPFIECPW